jgi:eukaryotic-like serine/threonine-protein kinase
MEKKLGRKIGKYELIAKVGQGGMGTLYKARHPTLNRVVLLKKLVMQGGSHVVERFRREARLMMDFKDERIVQVHDHFKEGSDYFIVEEFVDGISLEELIRKERYLSNEAATLVLYEVCKALSYLHEKHVVHRDIKPGNVLISRRGEIKLADFGIATSREEPDDGLTREGTILGTPAYIAPEQIDDARSVDNRADIYSLGVVLYEMLTGKTPFPGSFTAETLRLIHKGKYAAARRLNPTASAALCRIARTCMKVRPARRYQDLSPIIRALEKRIRRTDRQSIKEGVQRVLRGADITEMFRRRRSGVRWLVGVALAAVVLAAGGYILWEKGFYYEYLAASRFGAMMVSVEPESSRGSAPQLPVLAALSRDADGVLTRLSNLDFAFQPRAPAGHGGTLDSRTLYLPTGSYRLEVSRGGELSIRSFTLQPRTMQRSLLATLKGQRIVVRGLGGAPLPLEVHVSAVDARTGRDITPASETSIYSQGAWMPLALLDGASLTSGRSYRLRVQSDGYREEEFDLDLASSQARVSIEAQLAPRTAAKAAQ